MTERWVIAILATIVLTGAYIRYEIINLAKLLQRISDQLEQIRKGLHAP